MILLSKQEYIPVGCVPTATVAATRMSVTWGSAYRGSAEGAGSARGDLPNPLRPVNRQTGVKTLLSFAVGNDNGTIVVVILKMLLPSIFL